MNTEDEYVIRFFDYAIEIGREHFRLLDPRTGHVLFAAHTPLLIQPEYAEPVTGSWRVTGFQKEHVTQGAIRLTVRGENKDGDILTVEFRCFPTHMQMDAEVLVNKERKIAFWNLFERGLHLNFFHAHHWRNRHGHTQTYETYNLFQGGKTTDQVSSPGFPQEMRDQFSRVFKTTTFSSDWHFNPHPSFMLFQRDAVMLGFGARELPQGFGLEMSISQQKLEYLRYNYGGEHGLMVPAGATSRAPDNYIWLDHNGGVWDSVDHYVRMLQEDGCIPVRSLRDVPHWWLRPTYCTWGDQGYLSGNSAFYNFPGDEFVGKSPVVAFDAAMLDYLLDTLHRENYPFGTVIIDDGWQKTRGDWEPHPQKFPNLRAQIDRIHQEGMKAILWLAPFDIFPDAEIRRHTEWLCGDGVEGRHGMPLFDFSNPAVQRDYVEPLARFLFSSEDGCLDSDGLKLDFMADKIHPVFPVYDLQWRGEERFSFGWQRMMYSLLKQWKPDGQMLGGTAHPYFIGCQDLVRTYDVPVSQQQHADRAEMIRHFNPGNLVALDMCETKSFADVEGHFAIAYDNNLLYECGRIANVADGHFSSEPDYASLLHRKLAPWSSPALERAGQARHRAL